MTAPPDGTGLTWHEHAPAVADAARVVLRLREDDPDTGRLEPLARAAARAIDARLGLQPATGRMFYPVSDVDVITTYHRDAVPADVLEAARQVTVELYRRKDVRFGVLPDLGAVGESVRVSRDQLAGVESLLAPHIESWGLA